MYINTIYKYLIYENEINKDQAKKILAEWIKVSGNSSRHSQQVAADFSKRNYSQYSDFDKILKNDGLKVSEVYKAGNFHVQYS